MSQCDNCGHTVTSVDGISGICNHVVGVEIPPIVSNRNRFIGIIGGLVLLSLIIFAISSFVSSLKTPDKEFKDMTNKEMQQFLEYENKEQQKKLDNEKFFK